LLPTELLVLPTEEPVLATKETVPIIWDDDGSIDGVTALLYLLQHPSYEVKAATISPGIAHPDIFARKLARFFTLLGIEGIPIAAGRDRPLSGNNAFPDEWRLASDEFWGLDLPEQGESIDDRTAAELIVDVINGAEQPVTVFVSGPLTNLAEAFRADPTIKEGIRVVEVMGGAVNVGGNVRLADGSFLPAEWNIYIDPSAAGEVLASGVDIRLTPLDSTDRVNWIESDAAAWEASNAPLGSMAAQLLRYTLSDWSSSEVLIWDLVAVLNTADRGLCEWEELSVDVAQDMTTNQGQIIVFSDRAANVSACLGPDPEAYKDAAQEIFGTQQ
jgi:purine nucleosidase/pyrimidine-specific ribonucleoside hydrolase